jgi:hypothetical protein
LDLPIASEDDQELSWLTFSTMDLDGDGTNDLVVGVPGWRCSPIELRWTIGEESAIEFVRALDDPSDLTSLQSDVGAVFAYSGADLSLMYGFSPGNEVAGDQRCGRFVLPFADVDRDGGADFVVGTPSELDSAVYLVSGATGATIWANDYPDGLSVGTDLDVLDDMNRDGVPEVLVGGCSDTWSQLPHPANGSVGVLSGRDGTELYVITEHELPELRQGVAETATGR